MKSLMEQLHENPLQIALVENEELRTQLAKANEQLQSVCNHNATQQPEITRLRAELAKLEQFHETVAYRCFLAGLTTEKPREPNAQNNTASAISHFNVMVDHHARSASRHILEQLRKEQE